jgi:hypothetical protein
VRLGRGLRREAEPVGGTSADFERSAVSTVGRVADSWLAVDDLTHTTRSFEMREEN